MTDNNTNNSCIPLPLPNIACREKIPNECSLLACVRRSDSYEVGDPKDITTCSVSVHKKKNTCTCNYKDKN